MAMPPDVDENNLVRRVASLEAHASATNATITAIVKASDKIDADVRQVPTGMDRLETTVTRLMDEKLKGAHYQIEAGRMIVATMDATQNAKIEALTRAINTMRDALSNAEGASKARSALITVTLTVVGILATVMGVYIAVSRR